MSRMPDYELEVADEIERPDDPLTNAYEDYQESDEWSKALSAVAGVKVDDVDAGPFLKRDIPLSEVVGADAATDVAAEGLLIGFEAGFRYGTRGAQGYGFSDIALIRLVETVQFNNQTAYRAALEHIDSLDRASALGHLRRIIRDLEGQTDGR